MSWISVVMERLVSELGSLLKMLEHETVSQATTDKMASVRNILDSLQLSGTQKRQEDEFCLILLWVCELIKVNKE